MSTRIEKSIEINRPQEEVFEYVGDIDRLQDWATTVIVEPRSSGSRVTLDFEYDLPGGFLGKTLNELYLERRSAREAEHSLQNLEDILEGRSATPAAS